MKRKLKRFEGKRITFLGTFERYGFKNNSWTGETMRTILLKDLKTSEGLRVADHSWFNLTKEFEKLGDLQTGNKIQFDARVKGYLKGYCGYKDEVRLMKPVEEDFRFDRPTKIIKI